MSKVGIVKIRQATRPSIVSQNYSAKIDISDLSGVNLGGIKEGDILVYSANTGNFEVRTASISGNNDSALTQYAANHANSAFAYANTISGGSAIDNVARVAATSAGVYANLAYNHANAAFNAANTGSSSVFTQSAYNHANAAFTSANSINGVNTTQNNSITFALNTANAAFASANVINGINTTQNNSILAAFNHANAAFNTANTGGAAGVDTYARNHANSAFAYANTISGGSAIDNVARVAATSAGVYANAAFNAANNKVSKSGDIMTGDLKFGGGGGILNLPTDQIAITANVDNDASGFIAQATGVTTVYANTDVIIQANTGGTNLQWNFNKNGTLIFPDSTIQTTAFTGSAIDNVARVAANNKVSKSGDTLTGSLQFFGSDFAIGQYQIGAGNGIDFWANNNTSYAQLNFSNTNFVYVDSTSAALETTNSTVTSHSTGYSEIWASADGNNYYWRFNGNGVLRFPDATLQNTAFTGYAIDNVARNTANSSLSINTGGVVAGAIRATNFVSNSYIEFGDGSRQFTANAGSGGGGGATNLQDYFPTDTNWGFIGNLFSSLGENLIVQYDCKDEPITPRGYLLQKDFGYLT